MLFRSTAKKALQGGAYDFIEKPIDLVVFRNLVQRAAETVVLRNQNSRLKGDLSAAYGFEGIIGDSPAMCAPSGTAARKPRRSSATVPSTSS